MKLVSASVLPARSTKAVGSSVSVYSAEAAVVARCASVTFTKSSEKDSASSVSTSSTRTPSGAATANSSSSALGGVAIFWLKAKTTVAAVVRASVDSVTGATGAATGWLRYSEKGTAAIAGSALPKTSSTLARLNSKSPESAGDSSIRFSQAAVCDTATGTVAITFSTVSTVFLLKVAQARMGVSREYCGTAMSTTSGSRSKRTVSWRAGLARPKESLKKPALKLKATAQVAPVKATETLTSSSCSICTDSTQAGGVYTSIAGNTVTPAGTTTCITPFAFTLSTSSTGSTSRSPTVMVASTTGALSSTSRNR